MPIVPVPATPVTDTFVPAPGTIVLSPTTAVPDTPVGITEAVPVTELIAPTEAFAETPTTATELPASAVTEPT